MKILRVISSVRLEVGGPINGLINSTQELVEAGHDVHVASMDGNGGVSGFPFQHFSFEAKTKLRLSNSYRHWLHENIKNYDVVIIHGLWQSPSYLTSKICKKNSVPYVIFCHGMLDPWFNSISKAKKIKKNIYWKLFECATLRDANFVLFTSEEERRLANTAFFPYHASERVVAYGSPVSPYPLVAAGEAFKSKNPELCKNPFFLFLSRVHPKKGVDLLIRAFAEAGNGMSLAIAGPCDEKYKQYLSKLADELGVADSIYWLGMLDGEDKWGAFSSCDAFILPSHQENFGIVVSEALSTSTAVLTTNKVNIWSDIVDFDCGRIENDDVEGVTKLVGQWVSLAQAEKNNLAKNSLDCYQKRFSIEAAAADLESVMYEAAGLVKGDVQ